MHDDVMTEAEQKTYDENERKTRLRMWPCRRCGEPDAGLPDCFCRLCEAQIVGYSMGKVMGELMAERELKFLEAIIKGSS